VARNLLIIPVQKNQIGENPKNGYLSSVFNLLLNGQMESRFTYIHHSV